MVAMAEQSLTQVAAWPTGTLHARSGSVVGFLMPKVGGHRPVFQLYGPKLRLQEFPRADWRFLIHAAANAARAFSTVHASGLVTGDVNHGNLVVAQDGVVRLIDCDSFQVTKGGQTWFCPVGVGTHQPPEMQAVTSYAGIRRTPNHDNFGLAVIIFQLLCMARHPFAGRHLGSGEPPSIEEAIAGSRYAYARERARTQMAPPPGSLAVDALTPRIQDFFEQAFCPGSTRGSRPSPDQWVMALKELGSNLRQCSVNRGHHYRNVLVRCPWCDIEAASGTPLFPAVFVAVGGQPSGMVALWQQVTAIAEPSVLPPMPNLIGTNATPSAGALEIGRKTRRIRLAAFGSTAAAIVAALALVPSGLGVLLAGGTGLFAFIATKGQSSGVPDKFRRQLQDAEREWETLRQAWTQPLPGTPMTQERAKLGRLKTRYDALPNERAGRMRKLSEQIRQTQLENHLDKFVIANLRANSRIPGIGRAKVATLSAYGIDTAADITESRIRAIPGFGPAAAAALLTWRHQHEQSFQFDPSKGVSQADIVKVEHEITIERDRLAAEVAAGLARLKAIANAAAIRRRLLESSLSELQSRLAQAKADAKAADTPLAGHKQIFGGSIVAMILALVVGLKVTGPSYNTTSSSLVAPLDHPAPGAGAQSGAPPSVGTAKEVLATLSARPVEPPPDAVSLPKREQSSEPRRVLHQAVPELVSPILPSQVTSQPQTMSATADGRTNSAERMVTRQTANVREAPNLRAGVVRTIPLGTVIHVFGRSNGWVQVGENGPWGWVSSSLLNQVP